MMNAHWDRLIEGRLDDLLTESEETEFAALMRDSEAARHRFWELAEVHGLARDAARIAWPEPEVASVQSRRAIGYSLRSDWMRPLGLVAAGLLLGVLMTGLAWAITRPQWIAPQVLLSESFESGAAPVAEGVPTVAGLWSGDVTEVVAGTAGVQPASDRQMLRFLSPDFAGKPNPGGYIGEIYRLIDLRDFRGELTHDDALVQVSALFNAATFPDGQTYHCSVAVYALDGETATDGSTRQAAALIDRSLSVTRRSNQLLDRDPDTWQKVSTELRLPSNTEYLLIRIAVAHGKQTKSSEARTAFSAHFADDVRVTLARRPLLP